MAWSESSGPVIGHEGSAREARRSVVRATMWTMPRPPSIHFLGHSTLRIDLDGARILTDPVLRSIIGPLVRSGPTPTPGDYHDTDLVLISHLHRDHLDLPSLRQISPRPLVAIPRGAGALMLKNHLHEFIELEPGESLRFGGLTIRAVPADHSGDRPPNGPTGPAMGYLIEGSDTRIYFAGDTDLFPGMAEMGAPDIALLPVGGWGPTLGRGHMDPLRAARALELIRPRIAVPIHWGTFWPRGLGRVRVQLKTQGGERFRQQAAEIAPDVQVLVVQPGHRVPLPHETPTATAS
jgi:L-ascorbate metabolism protein UlaG (beta-lactamase superfamily)